MMLTWNDSDSMLMFPGGHYGQQLLLKIFYVLKLRPHPIGLLMLVSVLMLGVRKEEYPG